MIPLAIIMAFLTIIITLFFNFLSNAWKDLKTETKDVCKGDRREDSRRFLS